jgi:hypothetical protein
MRLKRSPPAARGRRVVVTRVAGSVEFPAGFTLSDVTLGILPHRGLDTGGGRGRAAGPGAVRFSSRP